MPQREPKRKTGKQFANKEEMIEFLKEKMTEEQFVRFTQLLEEGESCMSARKIIDKSIKVH
jgi:hypothetical protein